MSKRSHTDAPADAPGFAGFDVSGPAGEAPSARPTLGVMLPVFGLLDGTIHPDRIGEAAVYGEDHGLDGLWLGDHLDQLAAVCEVLVPGVRRLGAARA